MTAVPVPEAQESAVTDRRYSAAVYLPQAQFHGTEVVLRQIELKFQHASFVLASRRKHLSGMADGRAKAAVQNVIASPHEPARGHPVRFGQPTGTRRMMRGMTLSTRKAGEDARASFT